MRLDAGAFAWQCRRCPAGAGTVAQRRSGSGGLPADHGQGYEGNETQQLARELGYMPVVPPNPNRVDPWEYDRVLYRRRNEIERLFRRLKAYRRVFSRFEKLDVLFVGFIVFVLIFEALRISVNRP